jgi:hypothetical protein
MILRGKSELHTEKKNFLTATLSTKNSKLTSLESNKGLVC